MTVRAKLGDVIKASQGAGYGRVAAQCGACRGRLRVEVETDGMGGLVEIVEPCPRCIPPKSRILLRGPERRMQLNMTERGIRRRERVRAKRAAELAGGALPPIHRVCVGCNERFAQEAKSGRPYSYCSSCREARAA